MLVRLTLSGNGHVYRVREAAPAPFGQTAVVPAHGAGDRDGRERGGRDVERAREPRPEGDRVRDAVGHARGGRAGEVAAERVAEHGDAPARPLRALDHSPFDARERLLRRSLR